PFRQPCFHPAEQVSREANIQTIHGHRSKHCPVESLRYLDPASFNDLLDDVPLEYGWNHGSRLLSDFSAYLEKPSGKLVGIVSPLQLQQGKHAIKASTHHTSFSRLFGIIHRTGREDQQEL